MWQTVDPEGRLVVLTEAAWEPILDGHRELTPRPSDILAAVAIPDERIRGRYEFDEWFYRSNPQPSPWQKVVVHFCGQDGSIVTAFPRT